jgi:hypothetical protein
MASQLAEQAAMDSSSTLLRAILDYFLLCHEVMADLKLKQHPKVLFSVGSTSIIKLKQHPEVFFSVGSTSIIKLKQHPLYR